MKEKYLILVNKANKYKDTFKYKLIRTHSKYAHKIYLEKETFTNWKKLRKEAKKEGLNVEIESGYRTFDVQKQLYNNEANKRLKKTDSIITAPPGYSEHETGLALNYCLYFENKFLVKTEMKQLNIESFMKKNAYKYGFIIRYPLNKENITGYTYKPWHLRYVGEELAQYLNEHELTLEEYYKEKSLIK